MLWAIHKIPSVKAVALRVPKPERLAAMKAAAMVADRSRTFQELADIRMLLGLPAVRYVGPARRADARAERSPHSSTCAAQCPFAP